MNETGSTNIEPFQINDGPSKCGMPLLIAMFLDYAIKKGDITVERAVEMIRELSEPKGDEDARRS